MRKDSLEGPRASRMDNDIDIDAAIMSSFFRFLSSFLLKPSPPESFPVTAKAPSESSAD